MVIILKLKNFLKTDKNARKVFGKREIEIIIKQLEGQNLTQSERNVISRNIKPKLSFIKEASKFKDEFKLEKNQDNKMLIEKAKGVILNHRSKDNIGSILLFGSFADKTFTKRSDIDICVLFKKDISLDDAAKFRIDILGELPDNIDIQVFNILPQKIKKSIALNHKVLYKSPYYDNIDFSVKYLKDDDYFIRMSKIFGADA